MPSSHGDDRDCVAGVNDSGGRIDFVLGRCGIGLRICAVEFRAGVDAQHAAQRPDGDDRAAASAGGDVDPQGIQPEFDETGAMLLPVWVLETECA
jgi:hypothetical protein